MADVITQATRENNSDTTIKCWHISYDIQSGGNTNSFVVVIRAEEMTDPTDKAEAKTLANAIASTKKSNWVTALSMASVLTDEPTLSGVVAL